jgi:phosphate binding protein
MQHRNRLTLVSLLLLTAIVVGACAPAAAPTAAPVATKAPAAAEPTKAPVAEPTKAPAVEPTKAPEPTAAPAAPAMTSVMPEVDPAAVTGDIVSAGSSTVFPLSEAMAARFQDEGYKANITIDSIGSGAGLERFCKTGETDIANASRAIKSSEVDSCKAIGRTPIEFRVGTDALAVVVNKENTWLADGVTLAELAKIFGEAKTWAEVNPAWPAEPILRFSPGTDSGTFDYFVEAVMAPAHEKDLKLGEEAILKAENLQLSEDDNVLVQGVEGDKDAIGYFGYAYYQENADKLQLLTINGVTASAATVDNNSYPLARPLFLYSDATIMQEKLQVADYINFFLTYVNEEIESVGYFPASDAALDEARAKWLEAMGQ